jgi:hypothetical protein
MISSGYHREILKIGTISSHLVKGEDHMLDLNGAHAWLLYMWALILVKFLAWGFTLD